MTDEHTLIETELAMRTHIADLDIDLDAAYAVSSVYRAANAVRGFVTNEVLRPYGLSWTGWVVLWVVWIWDGLESRRAAEAAAISKGTLTGVVKTLEARGWLARHGVPGDRRLVELRLTPEGLTLMRELYPRFNRVEARVVASLSQQEAKQMAGSLRSIVEQIEGVEPGVEESTA